MSNFLIIPFANLILFIGLFYQTIKETAIICWTDDDYSHGIILPLISIYLIRQKLPEIKKFFSNQTFSIFGLFLLVTGILILLVGSLTDLLYLRWLSLFITLTGLIYLNFSKDFAKEITAPLLLNFMAKPLPDSLIPKLFFPLQVIAAKVSYFVLDFLEVPVRLKGNIIEIPGMQLMVEEACSGLRSLIALLTVAAIVVSSMELKFYQKLLLLAFSIITAIVLNIFRVATTGLLAHFVSQTAATGFFHTFSGLIVFTVGLIILYTFANFLTKRKND